MPLVYRIEPELKLITVSLTGTVTDVELVRAQAGLFADPKFRGDYSRLVDGTDLGALLVSGVTVRYVAQEAERRGMRRVALVADSQLVYALMRMYECYISRCACEVFRDFGSAVKWLTPEAHYPS